MNDKLNFWLWIASRIDEQETHPVVRSIREKAVQEAAGLKQLQKERKSMLLRSSKMSVSRTPINFRPVPAPRTLLTEQPQPSLTAANLEIINLRRCLEEISEDLNQCKKDALNLQKEFSVQDSELLNARRFNEKLKEQQALQKDQLVRRELFSDQEQRIDSNEEIKRLRILNVTQMTEQREQQRQINQQLKEDTEARQRMDDHGLLLINSCVNFLEKQKDLQHRFEQLSLFSTNTDTHTDINTEESIFIESNLVDTHLTYINNKLESPSSNTVRKQNASLTNAVVDDTILNKNLNVNVHNDRLEPGLEIPVTNAVVIDISNISVVQKTIRLENVRMNSALATFKLHKHECNMDSNLNVPSMNAAIDDTILKLHRRRNTLKKIKKTDLGYLQNTMSLTKKDAILQMLGSFRFRSARFGTKASMIEVSEFLITTFTSLSFDGGGRIRIMTSFTSMPFDGGGWTRMTL